MPGLKRTVTEEKTIVAYKKPKTASKKRTQAINTKLHHFVRSVSNRAPGQQLSYDLRLGWYWNGVALNSHNLQFNFTLGGVQMYCGGTLFYTAQLPNSNELTSLYDQYRLDYIEMQPIFSNNMSNVTTSTITLPIMYVCKDYDDSNDAGIADIQQYQNHKVFQVGQMGGKNITRVRPNVDVVVYQSPALSGYARGRSMFLDTGSAQVPHYGIKIAMEPMVVPGSTTLVGYFTFNFKYHITMLNTK